MSEPSTTSDRPRPGEVRRNPGDLFFAIVLLAIAVLLLSQIGEQTRWFNRVQIPLQPRFWPAVILTGLALFAGLYVLTSILARRRGDSNDRLLFPGDELLHWLRPLEYAAYFVLYAASIPWLGYLLATVVFMPLLGIRVGVRTTKGLASLAVVGLVIVLAFKTGLEVRMPPGVVYEWLPDALRNFMIRHF